MINEKDIQQIYEAFYKIAKTYEDANATHNLYNQLMDILSDGRLPSNLVIKGKSPKNISEHLEAVRFVSRLHNEYGSKFRELEKSQKTLEAKTK